MSSSQQPQRPLTQRPFAAGIGFSEFVGEENARAFAELFGTATGQQPSETYRRVSDTLPTTPPPPPREPYRRFQPPPPPTAAPPAAEPAPEVIVPQPRENEIPETPRTPPGGDEEGVVMYAPPTPFNPLAEDERLATPTFPPATPPVTAVVPEVIEETPPAPPVIEPPASPAPPAELPSEMPVEREASPVPPPPVSPLPPVAPEMPPPPREASPESSPAAPASPGWSPAAPSPIAEPPASPPAPVPPQNMVADDASAPPLQDLFNVNAGVQAAPRGYVLSVWPLSGPASDQFMVLHVGDPLKAGRRTLAAGQQPFVPNGWREMIVLLDLRTRPIRVERYNYGDRRVQPRWVDERGNWLSRRTLVVPPDERTRRTQGARRVRNSEQAKPEVPDFVHYVDWHPSLTDLLEGRQAALSLLFPSQTTGDFPEHMALVSDAGADRRVVAIGSGLQITPDSRVYEYKVSGDDTELPAFTAVGDPLGAAEPVATRAAEQLYVADIVNGANDKQVVVWNGNAYTLDNGSWDVTGLFALSDGLGPNVTSFSGVRLGADRFYYVSNEQLWLQRNLGDDPEQVVLSDAVDVVGVSRGPGNTLLISGKPYGSDRVATVVAVTPQVREWAIDREQLGLDADVTVKAIRWQAALQRFVVVAGPRVFTASLRAVGLEAQPWNV